MGLSEAVRKSFEERPDEWTVEGEESPQERAPPKVYVVVLHKRTGMKVRADATNSWATSSELECWSPTAKQWFTEYAGYDACAAVRNLRARLLSRDRNERLPRLLEGTHAKFTDDAERLARAILEGHVETAFGACDEILETMTRPEGA